MKIKQKYPKQNIQNKISKTKNIKVYKRQKTKDKIIEINK
jgi:hypothetical protein